MGKSRAEYMREYHRKYQRKKREKKLRTENVEPKKIARNSTQRNRDFRARRRAANLILSQTSTATADPTTALPNLTVNHATLQLPSLSFSRTPSASTATACNTGPSDINPRPADIEQQRVVREEDSSLTENEIKVFCPKCDTEVSHVAEGIQEEQTKIHIAKVYYYFEREYEVLKTIYRDLDLTPLSKFRQRTALATGVSEMTVLQILKELEGWKANKPQEPPENRRRARKSSTQKESLSEEDSSDDNEDVNEQSSDVHEAQMVFVKVEPPEYYNEVPVTVKIEPSDIELNKALTVEVKIEPPEYYNEKPEMYVPATVKVEPSDVVPNKSSPFGDKEIKAEEIEIHEEGVG